MSRSEDLHMEVHKVPRLPRKLEFELLKLELTGARAIETTKLEPLKLELLGGRALETRANWR